MLTLLRREFVVDVPLETAWRLLARVEEWPRWARHIRRVELRPSGELGPKSTGRLYLANGLRAAFTMTEFHLFRNWKWVGEFLWLTVHYDHRFEELGPRRTRLTWIVEGDGFGVTVLGRLFAHVYRRSLDRAIPRLIEQMNGLKPAASCGERTVRASG